MIIFNYVKILNIMRCRDKILRIYVLIRLMTYKKCYKKKEKNIKKILNKLRQDIKKDYKHINKEYKIIKPNYMKVNVN